MDLLKFGYCVLLIVTIVSGQQDNAPSAKSAFNALTKVFSQCGSSDNIIKCFKLQAIRLTNRALKLQNIKLLDGISVIKKSGYRDNRSYKDNSLDDNELNNLTPRKLDDILYERASKLFESHQLQVNLPRLMSFGQNEVGKLIEEGRKKKKKYLGPFLAAIALKAGILKMAYHSIAIVAGKALIIGKIALVISAIIGLKKLVAPEGHEKTTYEIVKHPHVQQSHSYSSSHGEYDGHENGGGGQYHRSLSEKELQDRVYKAHVPQTQ